MNLTDELRAKHHDLWERMVTHPFVVEMGEGTLPTEKFAAYFLQDYIFVADLVSITSLGMAKAPDLESAGVLNSFLTGILNPENDLFVRAFKELGVSESEYASVTSSPTTRAFGDFMVRVGHEGDFTDVATVLYVTEGTYLDWGTRLIEWGKQPGNSIYQEWIDIHSPAVLGDFVGWLRDYLDGVELTDRIETIFLTALRYEYLMWEVAYHGERWPDEAA